ncbi:hypothetical protein [Chromobacterium sp. IIBBL 290-4]|uniref:hypothetical protein n=1 Tax=Chromobacterium sp. IIBBL 290-4 TaxID=2953890 RepID=UPI0020B75547|nr:hypothetical protein [Chromobacterium sp. IIBBL 290-4]UTH73484.1 hypothetical protein NKT35_18365 [Chromobacterium sp. IIBBL 290-4]
MIKESGLEQFESHLESSLELAKAVRLQFQEVEQVSAAGIKEVVDQIILIGGNLLGN